MTDKGTELGLLSCFVLLENEVWLSVTAMGCLGVPQRDHGWAAASLCGSPGRMGLRQLLKQEYWGVSVCSEPHQYLTDAERARFERGQGEAYVTEC